MRIKTPSINPVFTNAAKPGLTFEMVALTPMMSKPRKMKNMV
jgi:hypothetical protein